ncbi:minor capsid protein [Fusobacterium sp.]|uniref:minor capsid protein n=1 Tax=Fusobacterium sp. TaxID=68766 RepID=UPI0026230C85|nr:minor capsid protein [Fusobacterium sp.]
MLKNNNYWQERFIKEEDRRNKDARIYLSSIEKQYDKALRNIEKDINNWYLRLSKNNDISLREAKILLSNNELEEFKWTVQEYIEKGQENTISKEWMKQLENASAKVHISKLEALKVQIQNEIEGLYGERLKGMEDYLERIYGDTYYKSAFIIQKGIGIGWSLSTLDTNKINQIIHKPWAIDGKNFSERIWEDKVKLINTLHTGLTQNIIRGSAPDDLIRQISKEFGVKKTIAGRLIMTESAAYSSKAQEQCFKDLDVEKYEIIATLDTSTSKICREMDGVVFPMKDYLVGVTANPFHPNCRTTTVPWFPDDVDTGERAARGKDGKVGYVSQNMTYKEWYNKYVEQKFEESGIIRLDNNLNNSVIKRCIEKEIEYIGIEKYSTIPFEEIIISELGGGDKTRGSCSSLAFAYAGNKNGYRVLDFRGGNSQAMFASNKTILEITELEGIKSWVVKEKNDFTAIKKLIVNVEEKKEYYLAIGRHAAIIRKIEKGYEYLELQSAKYNGFKTFDMNVLKNRFGCQKSYRRAGVVLTPPSMLIDIDTLKDNKEFNQILGFINTAKEKQLKGVEGYEK